jgi:hypothetical protein
MIDRTALSTVAAQRSPDPLTAEDRSIVELAPEFLGRGIALQRWWERTSASDGFAQRFELARTFNPVDTGFGFFDQIQVAGRSLPVLGNFQEMFYDRPKVPRQEQRQAAEWMRDQVREFVLRYFMRVSDFRLPEGYVDTHWQPLPAYLRPFTWCPREDMALRGFGFQQLYYKRADTGEVGKFPAEQRFAIVDLRELGPKYEWIVAKVCIFDFNLSFQPLGSQSPSIIVPLQEDSLLILSRDFIKDQQETGTDELGCFGFGYAFVKNPGQSFFAYGPGEFDAAVELIDFRVGLDGEVRVRMAFVANRPERIVNVSLNPLEWAWWMSDLLLGGGRLAGTHCEAPGSLPFRGPFIDLVHSYIGLANALTGGMAAGELCISREQLDREFLLKHFLQHYQAISGSLQIWRQIPDWLDGEVLPDWILQGRDS